MSIRKPADGTVRDNDFRDKAYSFVVESVLGPEINPGMVVLSSSVGYLLTTSLTHQPKREQVISHHQTDDGGWLATDVVTLLVTEASPPNGTVTIRDQRGDTVVLRINPVSTSPSRLASPLLTVSERLLRFPGTLSGEPSFQVLFVAQQHSTEPLTLTTNAPEYFQLASDSQPAFTSALTVTPSPLGTYIHIRYAADIYGSHMGQLTIQNSVGKETVTLNGHNRGLLAALRSTGQGISAGQGVSGGRKAGLLALTLLVGLAYVGYANRCQLFPALCQNATAISTVTGTPVSAPVSGNVNRSQQEAASRKKTRTPVVEVPKLPNQRGAARATVDVDRLGYSPISDASVTNKQNSVSSSRSVVRNLSLKPATQVDTDTVVRRTRRRVPAPVPPAQESELERELNGNLQN